MFIDWLTLHQDFDTTLPFISDTAEFVIDTDTGDVLTQRQPAQRIEGSYSTSISVRISGGRITVKGNPSRFNRLDNLFGFTSIDDCVSVYNNILLSLGLPPFTRCTRVDHLQSPDGKKAFSVSDGAVITEIHITTNKSVGEGNTLQFIRALSTQRYRNSIPRLHPNGCTLDWLSKRGNAPLIYADVYDKANEIELHQLDKIKKKCGTDSSEYAYLLKILNYCKTLGVARFEQKLKSRLLRRENLQFWGLSDFNRLDHIHSEFLAIDQNLKADAMTYQTLSQQLIDEGICKSTLSANSTANYAFMWMHGEHFDITKSHIKRHRARLRRLGIDIAEPCDITKFTPVRIKHAREITVSTVAPPSWYRHASVSHLRLVA